MAKKPAKKQSKSTRTRVSVPNLVEILEQSRIDFADGNYADVLKAVAPVKSSGTKVENAAMQELAQIGAWSAYQIGKFAKADEYLDSLGTTIGLGESETILKSLLHFEFREYAECIKTAEPILMPLSDTARADQKEVTSRAQLDLISCLAMSYYNIGEFESAANVYEEAIRARDDYAPFYINLAMIKGRLGDETGRRRVISDGLIRCSDKGDLDKLAKEIVGEEKISLCMIVKNEEKLLGQCLESAKDLVSEIIVVDTGSTDNTVAIAEKYGARVYHHPWQNDFSLHRNQSLSYATGEWILILDADEELTKSDIEKIRQATRVPNVNVISLSVHNKQVSTGEVTSFLPSVRMWRRRLNAKYEGIVHNELRLPADETILRVDAKLIHYGYGLDWEQMKKKIARSKELLYRQLEESPNNFFANFNLSQLLRGEHKMPPPEVCRQIIEHSGRAVKNSSPDAPGQRHIHLMALDQMVSAYFYLGDYRRAEECALRALSIEPGYLDPMFQLGHVYAGARDFDRAIKAYAKYIEHADRYDPGAEITSFILIHSRDQGAAYFSLGLIHEELQMDEKAEYYFNRVLDYKKDHLDLRTHLAMIRYRRGDLEGAAEQAQLRVASNRTDLTAHFLLAQICHRQGSLTTSRKHCLDVLAIDAQHTEAMLELITLERETGNTTEAMHRIDQLLAIKPTHNGALNHKAEILTGQGHFSTALDIYHHMANADPSDAELQNNLGNCYFKQGDFKTAMSHYAGALALKPQLVPALRNMGLTQFKLGDKAGAVKHLANYLDHAASDFDVTYLVARLYFDLSAYPDALRYAEKCATTYPRSPELISFVSDCYLRLGHVASAKLGYSHALEVNPDFAPAKLMLSELDKLNRSGSKI